MRHYARYARNARFDYYKSQKTFLSVIIANYHVIEKCLAMPNFECGHGKERVAVVCGDLMKYRELGFDQQNIQYQCALRVIDEYNRVHKACQFDLGKLQEDIDTVLDGQMIIERNQPCITKEDFYKYADSAFSDFAKSRHSCRAFSSESISYDIMKDIVDLARTTPTACNRQPNKTYVVDNKDYIKNIITWQSGGRGFAEEADKILIMSSDSTMF